MEAMGSLTGGVAHDFNNLLTPIMGSLDLISRTGARSAREQRLIAGALQSAEKAKTLVQRLLAFARQQPLKAVAVNVVKLVRDMAELIASTTGPKVKVVLEAPDNLPPACGDPNQLEMALLNLSVNARDAMPDGGTLTISLSREEAGSDHPSGLPAADYIRLSVADTGIGMDEQTVRRAVEPFFSTKGVGKGTGLGLSMVHGLAAQLGGAVTIWSKPGVGTKVDLWLPVSEEEVPQLPPAQPEAKAAPARGTVLLVDDEDLVRASTADMLADLGFEVLEATSAEEALRMLRSGASFDLLVTDHLMPGITGTELALQVQANRPDVPVLVISGYSQNEDSADVPRLAKPFRQAELAAKLQELTKPAWADA
jgi:CheY-like chemotaxis protein